MTNHPLCVMCWPGLLPETKANTRACIYRAQVTKSTKNHKAHDAFLEASRSDLPIAIGSASVVVVVTLFQVFPPGPTPMARLGPNIVQVFSEGVLRTDLQS